MKRMVLLFVGWIVIAPPLWAQTNVFPDSGFAGIGTLNPDYDLEIIGSSETGMRIKNETEHSGWGLSIGQRPDLTGYIKTDGRDLQIGTGWDKKLILGFSEYDTYGGGVVIPWGNVGIGTDNPTAKLAVSGTIKTKEIVVTEQSADWPDYVFKAGYQPPDLLELEAFINKYKHLPGIPTKDKIERDGQNLGGIQAQLLKKIEELTLYVIELENRVDALERKNKMLNNTSKGASGHSTK